MKKLFIGLLFYFIGISMLWAVPASPHMEAITQPDGSVVNVYLKGDEHFSYLMSEDGFLLTYADNGFVEYARLNAENKIVSVGVKATRVADRSVAEKQYLLTAVKVEYLKERFAEKAEGSMLRRMMSPEPKAVQKSYPLKGSPKSLVILVSFKDIAFQTPQQNFHRLLNEEGYSDNGGTGSARDYFKASSNGIFSPDFVVVGPYVLPQDCRFYGEQVNDDQNDRNPGQMVIDACRAAENDIDFKEFDTDDDGALDNVFIYYAGYNQAENAPDWTIWPHRSKILTNVTVDGVMVRDYACTSEFRKRSGSVMCGIGTFCHEFGHVLTLPDFYVTDYKSDHPTLEDWDIMDHGSYINDGCSPPTYSAYERFYLGWLTPELLNEEKACSLEPLAESNKAYLVSSTGKHNLSPSNPTPNEFWMVENRRRVGMDSHVPAEGLLVTHVVYSASSWNANTPNNDPNNMGVEIVCAAGTTVSPARNVFPGTDKVTTCQFVLRDGSKLETPLTSITESGSITNFQFGADPDAPRLELEGGAIGEFEAFVGEAQPTKVVRFVGSNLSKDITFILGKVDRSDYSIRKFTENGEEEFGYRLEFTPEKDSTLDVRIEIKFSPKVVSHDKYIEDKILVRSDEIGLEYALKGLAKEPIRIFSPKAYEAQDISPYSFKASWQKVEAASGYYLSVYSISDVESSEVEEFSTFDQGAPKDWSANFKTIQRSYTSSSPMAAYFTNVTDTLVSKEYFMPLSKLSYWIHAVNTTGVFKVDALAADGSWVNVSEKECNATTRSEKVEVPFKDEVYKKFRMYYTPQSGDGGVSFDDFTAYFSKQISYVLNNERVKAVDTMYTVSSLTTNTEYKYFVSSIQSDAQKSYEYVSAPSNEVLVTTINGEPANSRAMTIVRDADGNYRAYVPTVDENAALFIYTIDGRLVMEIPSTSSEFIIPRLVNGQVYILKYAEKGNQKRKTKVGKLFYQE